jgi:hypothetical protein
MNDTLAPVCYFDRRPTFADVARLIVPANGPASCSARVVGEVLVVGRSALVVCSAIFWAGPPSNEGSCGDRMRLWANRRKSRDDEKPRQVLVGPPAMREGNCLRRSRRCRPTGRNGMIEAGE